MELVQRQEENKVMAIDEKILNDLSALARANPRLRHTMDLRNSPEDLSQRMLNALEPGTVMPIHRHMASSETVTLLRGKIRWHFYDEHGNLSEAIDMVPGGPILNIEKGQWHSLKCLEPSTILFEAKDGVYRPLEEDEIMNG